jgi:hypothetical protein
VVGGYGLAFPEGGDATEPAFLGGIGGTEPSGGEGDGGKDYGGFDFVYGHERAICLQEKTL